MVVCFNEEEKDTSAKKWCATEAILYSIDTTNGKVLCETFGGGRWHGVA